MKWFRRRHRKMRPEQVTDPDPMMRAAIAEAWNTGGAVVATRNPDGTWGMKHVDLPDRPNG